MGTEVWPPRASMPGIIPGGEAVIRQTLAFTESDVFRANPFCVHGGALAGGLVARAVVGNER